MQPPTSSQYRSISVRMRSFSLLGPQSAALACLLNTYSRGEKELCDRSSWVERILTRPRSVLEFIAIDSSLALMSISTSNGYFYSGQMITGFIANNESPLIFTSDSTKLYFFAYDSANYDQMCLYDLDLMKFYWQTSSQIIYLSSLRYTVGASLTRRLWMQCFGPQRDLFCCLWEINSCSGSEIFKQAYFFMQLWGLILGLRELGNKTIITIVIK